MIEDVTDIVLNVKSLVVKNYSEQTRVVRIEKNTKGPITGADVRTDDQVEVINKDHLMATLTEDVPFLLEMVVENGRGYVPATEHTPQAQEIGIIPIDAAFSPVTRVRYEVEETRVGQKTNYDKLTIEIWTNGSVSPEMALVESAKILRKHLNPFVQYSELGPMVHSETRAVGAVTLDQATEAKLGMSLAELDLSVRATNCLESENITTVRDLVPVARSNCWKSATLARPRWPRCARNSPTSVCGWACGFRPRPPAPCKTTRVRNTVEAVSRDRGPRKKSHDHATSTKRPQARPQSESSTGPAAEPGHGLFLTERDAERTTTSPRSKDGSSPPSKRPRKSGRWSSTASPSPVVPCPIRRPPTVWSPMPTEQRAVAGWRHSDRWRRVESGDCPGGGRPPPRAAVVGRQAGGADPLRRDRSPFRRSRRRLHPRPAAGQAAVGRRRHPRDPRVCRQERPRSQARPPARRSSPMQPRSSRPPQRRRSGSTRP